MMVKKIAKVSAFLGITEVFNMLWHEARVYKRKTISSSLLLQYPKILSHQEILPSKVEKRLRLPKSQ